VDDRIRTVRIDQFWRGVVLAPDSGDTYYLMKVMLHDKAIIGVADGVVQSPAAVTAAGTDPLAHAQDLQRERCLLFVACTRARDHLYVSYSGPPSPFLGQG
jgi:hypothetical protein